MERNIQERINDLADAIDSGCDGKTVAEIAGLIAWDLAGEDIELEPMPGGFLSKGKRKPANEAEAIAQGVRTSAWRYLTALQNGVPADAAQKLRSFAKGMTAEVGEPAVKISDFTLKTRETMRMLGIDGGKLNRAVENGLIKDNGKAGRERRFSESSVREYQRKQKQLVEAIEEADEQGYERAVDDLGEKRNKNVTLRAKENTRKFLSGL